MNDERLATRVGFGVLVALVVGVALVLGLEGKHLSPGIVVHVELERTGALTEGAKVMVSGRQIGSVDRIRLLPRREAAPASDDPTDERALVVLDVWIEKKHAWLLRDNSEIFQNQQSVMGEAYLEVGPPRGGAEPGRQLRDGDTVRGIDPPRLDRIAQKSYENLKYITQLMRDGMPEARELGRAIDELSDTLATIEPDDQALERVETARLRLWAEALAAWATVKETGLEPADFQRRLAATRRFIALARADLAKLRERLQPLVDNVDAARSRLDPERFAEFERLIDRADVLTAKMDGILGQVDAIVAMIQRGEGTIGAFLADDEMADDVKAMLRIMKKEPWVMVGHPQ